MFRFLKVDAKGKLLDSRYYDTIGYTGGVYSDQPHTETSRDFCEMLLCPPPSSQPLAALCLLLTFAVSVAQTGRC